MSKKFLAPLIGVLVVILIIAVVWFLRAGAGSKPPAQAGSSDPGSADPQKLMIPRWFLIALTLDGQAVDIPAGQQQITIQFKDGGQVNGTGGCNSFGGTYQASSDGKLSFSPLASTMMACDNGMDKESAYFQALAKVQQFKTEGTKLTLSSADAKTSLVFSMPPK